MKILLVSWFFPPANTIGAVRIGGLARYLVEQGHDVRVIAGKDLPYQQSLAIDLAPDRVAYARWTDVNAAPKAISRFVRNFASLGTRGELKGAASARKPTIVGLENISERRAGLGRRLGSLYMNIFNWPDSRVGWLPFAYRAGRSMLRDWRPDTIFASGPPFTTLLVGYLLSRRHRLPLVIEFRDRWSDDPYYPPPGWRRRIDRFAERRIARHAVAITTVSEPWAETYRRTYGKPVAVICNGYDPDLLAGQAITGGSVGLPLRIVYTGGIYPGRRDPTPLFEAIRNLDASDGDIRVDFYGTDENMVMPLAARYSVQHLVNVHPPVSHREAVEIQRRADVLLLMQWNDPKEQGNVPGKFFEYLGALRPILVLGLEDGVPATIIRERNAGYFSNNPPDITEQLRRWIREKQSSGSVAGLPEQARNGYSRNEQYAKLERFLGEVLS